MVQTIEDSILKAIKKDDVKAFNALAENARCGEYRLGRFPVLSLMYLFRSRRLLAEYEEQYIKISAFEELREPIEISKKFSDKAGKCLRLYLNEVVSPLEMLLILDRTTHLKRVYPMTNPSSAVRGRLKAIYSIKYSLGIKFEGNGIVLDRRPLSRREKKKLTTVIVSTILIIAIAVGAPVTAVSLIPKPVEGEVTVLSDINFTSLNEYTLKNDIVLPENYTVGKMNCTISGAGKKLIFGKGASIGELNGKISDVIIETSGDPVFSLLTINALIENVTVNVNADVETKAGAAFLALTNYGRIDGVTVNISGSLSALATSDEATDELAFGGVVQTNANSVNNLTGSVYSRGVINNCTVNYSQFTLKGEASANATFGGVAGINSGFLQNCTVGGEIVADTFDAGGVCSVNNWGLVGNVNNANITQTSADENWNPNTAGIVLNNGYAVESCINNGNVSSVSSYGDTSGEKELAAISAGIACINSNHISKCTNNGEVTAEGKGIAYAGGIVSRSVAVTSNCLNEGDIAASAKTVYAGGILGSSEVTSSGGFVYFGTAESCISTARISVNGLGESSAFVGGIAGYIQEREFKRKVIGEDGSITEETVYFGGGVTNSYFTGAISADKAFVGNIAGACGANIYEINSYTSATDEYRNFENNVYLNDSLYKAFGTKVTVNADGNNNYASAEDKGASSAALEEIVNSDGYKAILKELENSTQD